MTSQVERSDGSGSTNASDYYDADYFKWQESVGRFGGWANADKFSDAVKPTDTVIDFGCGGGFLLAELNCARRIGIEPNDSAAARLAANGVERFSDPRAACDGLGEGVADIIISNNALEHTLNPLQEIKDLRRLLKPGGRVVFIVPCDSLRYRYNPKDIHYHLFSWSPQNCGNLFTEAGFEVHTVKPYIHKWPPLYQHIAKLGKPAFNLACRVYGHLERSWFQVRITATRPEQDPEHVNRDAHQ
ncbi:MAG: class I SAM-dependent methyltransferase [Burkholderiaceae bacterium]